MPIYGYQCECGNYFDDFCRIKDRKAELKCPHCGEMAQRDWTNNSPQKDNVRYSWSMAVNPDQIQAAMKAYPGSKYLSNGQLVVKNRREKLTRMKQRGLVELDN